MDCQRSESSGSPGLEVRDRTGRMSLVCAGCRTYQRLRPVHHDETELAEHALLQLVPGDVPVFKHEERRPKPDRRETRECIYFQYQLQGQIIGLSYRKVPARSNIANYYDSAYIHFSSI